METKQGVENLAAKAAQARKTRIAFSVLIFLYWAALGTLAFHVLLLRDCGFTSTQVGVVMALNFLTGIIGPPIWGLVADRIRSMKKTFLMVMTGTGLMTFLLPATRYVVLGSLPVVALTLPMFTLFRAPTGSLIDGWIVSVCNQYERMTYAQIRLWGSIGYAVMAMIFTFFAERCGIAAPYYMSVVVIAAVVLLAARQPDEQRAQVRRQSEGKVNPLRLLKNYPFVVLLLFNTVLTLCSNASGSFMPYLIEEIGADATLYGVVAGCKALFEVPIMLFGRRLIERYKLSTLVGMVGVLYLVEQIAYQFVQTLPQIFVAQCIQGCAYGLYLTVAIQYAYMLAPRELSASAQSMLTMTIFTGSILSSLLGGWLIEVLSIRGLYRITALVLAVGLVLYMSSSALQRRIQRIRSKPAAMQ